MTAPTYSKLEEHLKALLKNHCTGMDDHDESDCHKCKEMLEELMELIIQWNNS